LHTVALKNDGTFWVWGNNYYGQLGDGTNTNRNTPVPVSGLTGIITAISAGVFNTVALKNDRTVLAWGLNSSGQLGDGTTTDSDTPVPVSGLINVIAISAGESYAVALKNDGTVWAWGSNGYGQLGDGSTIEKHTPVPVSGLTGIITAISAGELHTVALKNDGTVWAWGRNNYGQLGDGTTTDSDTPVQASGLTGITAIAAGESHTVALKNDGTLWAWGRNNYGQLGDGTTTDSDTPVQVK
jgi:alpha-tubulin suppressor-like RCC1 family protein